MSLSLAEISDRIEIQDLLVEYCYAIDSRDWDALDDVFTPDATIDYTEMGGTRGSLVETKAFLSSAMANFAGFQHMISTSKVTVDGDTATGRTMCHNPMITADDKGGRQVFLCGFWYRDLFVRTANGWRIQERHEERSYYPTRLG
jgi:ketosteroid isomerase-like protein